jgi:hypothetical protein
MHDIGRVDGRSKCVCLFAGSHIGNTDPTNE